MAEAFLDAAREANAGIEEEDSPARVRLRGILDPDLAYQHELFDEVCELPLADAAPHLAWLADLMRRRADMAPPIAAELGSRHRRGHNWTNRVFAVLPSRHARRRCRAGAGVCRTLTRRPGRGHQDDRHG